MTISRTSETAGKPASPQPETQSPPPESLEERIRLRAYELWLADGEPKGREPEYWERAERDIAENPARTADDGIATTPIETIAAFGRRS